jgi:RND superfamily putative drug exporter
MLEWYGRLVYRFRVWFLVAGLVCMAAGAWYATGVYSSLTHGGFAVPGSQSEQADAIINQNLGGNRSSLVVLLSSPDHTVADPAFATHAQRMLDWLGGRPEVSSLASYYSLNNPQLVSNDGRSTYVLVGLRGTEDEQAAAVNRLRTALERRAAPLAVRLGGSAAVNAESNRLVREDLTRAELVTFPITAVLLVVIFRSLAAAALPLALGAYGIIGALVITRLATNVIGISEYVVNLITLLGLGLAIDYSLFIVSRFREELRAAGNDAETALIRTLNTAGRTVIFSALTVLVSLLGLTIFPVGFLRSMGVGGTAAVLVALLGALMFLPAILALLEHQVNALRVSSLLPGRLRTRAHKAGTGNWERIAGAVMRYPRLTVVITLALLVLAGLPFLNVHFINPDYRILPRDSQARQVGDMLKRDFPVNSEAPVQVVVRTDGPPASPANLAALEVYGTRLSRLPGVRSIEAPTGMNGRTAEQLAEQLNLLESNPKSQAQLAQFVNGRYVLINIIPSAGTFDLSTKQLVKDIRNVRTPDGLHALVGGQTADLVDLLAVIAHDGVYAIAVVLGAMLLLFFLMLGSLVIPLKTIVLNVLSLSAAFGALVWIFQEGHLAHLVGFTPEGGIDATQPVIILALAFGLSMDYAIFLFSRVKEYYESGLSTRQAVAAGVGATGGIITSAALLLMVVMGAFAAGRISVMKEVAIGLIVAILVDVFVVRLFLVPSSMRLLGKYNWWAPGPLKRLHAKFGFKDT